MELQLPRGMRDFPPEEKILRDRVIAILKEVFERYGFSPLETPIIERWEVLSAKYGGGEEILKETYKFTDQGGRELGLRYELTTSLARFVGMNPTIKRPFKRYQIGTVYRDGPIKLGRYREFYQCDVDTVGVNSVMTDAELMLIARDAFRELGFKFEIRVNHRQLLKDVAAYAKVPEELVDTGILSLDKLEKIGAEGVREEMLKKGISVEQTEKWLGPLDISGKNTEMLASIQSIVPESEGVLALAELFELIPDVEEIRFVPSLARGLGYYTGMIFEVFSHDPPFDGSLAGGGRYDNLIPDFLETNEPYPATGISFGLEPICELLKQRDEKQAKTVTQVYVLPIGVPKEGLQIAQKLRAAGINVDIDLAGKGVSANMKHANAYEIPYVVIVGQRELDEAKVNLKHMESGEERLLTLDEVIERVTEYFETRQLWRFETLEGYQSLDFSWHGHTRWILEKDPDSGYKRLAQSSRELAVFLREEADGWYVIQVSDTGESKRKNFPQSFENAKEEFDGIVRLLRDHDRVDDHSED